MKVIIDLIEEMRESIANAEAYLLSVGLLKEDMNDPDKLVYAGEALVSGYDIDHNNKVLRLEVSGGDKGVRVGELIPQLLILDMDAMMYQIKVDVNSQYSDMDVVGFGKNDEEQRFVLFIKI